jgi:hypothetical protein
MEYRISKLREYLFIILDTMLNSTDYQINANMLANDINNYSLDKIPTSSTVEKWINGTEIHRDVYSFRSRCAYSQDTINNLKNVGFFETFEKTIKSNNNKGILPNIEGIQSIECLNCASMVSAETNTAEFDIQIQITYKEV